MTPTVSLDVIVCTWNNAALLDRTLRSLEAQHPVPGLDWSLLVVDNNCTDDTSLVLQAALSRGLPLRVEHEPEQGLTPARLRGVRSTTRTWLAFVDDDCVLDPAWLAQTAAFIGAHPDCGAFGGRITLAWEGSPPAYALRVPYAFAGKNHGDTPHRRTWLAGLGMTVRRAALESTGWVERPLLADRIGSRLVSGGDMEIGLRIASRSHEVWYAPECRITHCIPERRTSRDYLARLLAGLGASRHQVAALTWARSAPAFAGFSIAVAVGFAARGLLDTVLDVGRPAPRAGPRVAFAPLTGWVHAMRHLWRLPESERRALIGAARPVG
ncbi:hypothetical protein TBR22_A06540 [Luteitalea sp. TBR-22]|uniref:glycosyltransferase n=1 Tax=Luteitalea sp. TBR-22 TaxID=2802971 RepID=UPI001AF0F72E|nr:glycosyltransferase [Luteitalea sp. TBR-22]BCS31453.1 hypothetical protein TBR22_A06540 [Luteitalea sp. TBR-22]